MSSAARRKRGRNLGLIATSLVVASLSIPIQLFFAAIATGYTVLILAIASIPFIAVPSAVAGTLLGLVSIFFRGGRLIGTATMLAGATISFLVIPAGIDSLRGLSEWSPSSFWTYTY